KLSQYNLDAVGKSLASVCKEAITAKPESRPIFPGAPKTFVEPGLDGRYIFSRDMAARILAYSRAINHVDAMPIRRLFRVLLASIVVSVSNVVVSGKGRRYRRGWTERQVPASRVDELFQESVLNAIYDLRVYSARACREFQVLRGDSRALLSSIEPLDAAV